MAWLKTIPAGTKDPDKKIYIHYYNRTTRKNEHKVTKFRNTPTGWAEARRFLKRFEVSLLDNNFLQDFSYVAHPLKLSEAFARFKTSRIIKPASMDIYRNAYQHFLKSAGDDHLHNYNQGDYNKLITDLQALNLKHNSIATYTKHLDIIFRWFVKQGYIKENFIKPLQEEPVQVRPIPPDDLKKIFEFFRNSELPHQYYLVRMLYLTGFRISTLITLTTDNIDFAAGLIYYRNVKGNKNSVLPIHRELEQLLRTYTKEMKLKPGDKLFPYASRWSLKFYPRGMEKLGMKYTLHQLRKTHATTLINNNINLYDAKTILDHSDVKTTQRYYILAQMDRIRSAMNKVRFVKVSVQKPVQKSKKVKRKSGNNQSQTIKK